MYSGATKDRLHGMLPLESAHCFWRCVWCSLGRQRTRFGTDLATKLHIPHSGPPSAQTHWFGGAASRRYINVWSSVSLCSLKGLNKHTLLAARPSRLHYMQKQEMFLKHREREGSLDCVPHVVLYLRVILKPLWTWKQDQKRSKPASFSRIPRLCSAPFDP